MSKGKPPSESDFDETAALPGAEDKLFEFTAVGPVTRSPYSTKQDWYFYINGYKDAADFLVAHLAVDGDARKLGMPILFLYRQHLELALKDLIRDCRGLLGCDGAFPKTHRIDELWGLCCTLLREISPGMADTEEMQHTSRLLVDFCKVDPTSEAFRYPEDKDGNPLGLDVDIDLGTVEEVVGKISLLLDCIRTDVHTRRYDAF